MAVRRRFKPFKPYSPPPIPSGSYDPALDAQRGAAQRGFGDVRQDVETAQRRGTIDYGLQTGQFDQQAAREQQDYTRNTQLLNRSFGQLAGSQTQQAAQAGVFSGGALLQAATKRNANQQIQQQGLDTAHTRFGEDLGFQRGLAQSGFERGQFDLGQQLERGGRENTQFGLDVDAQKAFQAGQAGYVPPGRGEPGGMPRGEFTNRNGVQRRKIVRGGIEYVVAPDGTVVHHRRVKRG